MLSSIYLDLFRNIYHRLVIVNWSSLLEEALDVAS